MSNTKKTNIILLLLILILFIVIVSFSFAYFNPKILNTESQTTIASGSGIMEITYSSGETITVPNIFPNDNPFITKEFTLTGKNTYNTKMEYHIILKMNTNTFRDGALAYTLTSVNNNNNGQTVQQIEYLNGIKTGEREVFLGNGFFEGISNASHTYTLKMYLPKIENFDHTVDQNKEFSAKIEIREGNIYPGYNEEKGVNHPVLFTGMTPVKWNENNEETETTEDDPDWYDYNEKRWANAKSADGSYWVWIPRYAYKIETCYHTSGEDCLALTGKEAGDIDVKFLKGTTNVSSENILVETTGYEAHVKDTSMHHFLHPAFQFNGEELGFWVAKYISSVEDQSHTCYTNSSALNCNTVDLNIKIIPNATTWRYIELSKAFYVSLNMKNKTDLYGWNQSEVDTHMLTNISWGAIAYLSKSQYGAHTTEVWNNSYIGYRSGCSGPNPDADSQDVCVEYDTFNGVKASTTHNIYGVYDMAGGTYNRVMGNYNNLIRHSGFISSEEVAAIETKYITRYYTRPEEMLDGIGMTYNSMVFGDAFFEISYNAAINNGTNPIGSTSSSWYSDFSYISDINFPWVARGGDWRYDTTGGVFNFHRDSGYPAPHISFRPAIFPLKY